MKQRYIGQKIRGGPIFRFLWSSSEFLMWDVTHHASMTQFHGLWLFCCMPKMYIEDLEHILWLQKGYTCVHES